MACCADLSIELKEDVGDGVEVQQREGPAGGLCSKTDSTGSLMDVITSPVAMIAKLVPTVPGYAPGAGIMREMVSQQKVRWKDGDVDLDLTYITPKIIAMGFPSHGAESFYRNPVDEVEAFLESRHQNHYRVYNLCSERKYDSKNRFGGNWASYPFDDHHPPMPISLIPSFIDDAVAYLSQDEANVVAVHCKAGKSRTGMMICCLLLRLHPALYPTPEAAMLRFAETRTSDGNGVTIPSQKRYIGYYARMLKGEVARPRFALKITKVKVRNLNHPNGQAKSPFFKIRTGNVVGKGTATVYNSKRIWTPAPSKVEWDTTSKKDRYGMDDKGVTVEGDVKIEFRDSKMIGADEKLFRFCFNVSMLPKHTEADCFTMTFRKDEIDQAHKDTQDKKYPRDLSVEVTFKKITFTEFEFRDPDGDLITMRKGPHPTTMIYSVNGEPRRPFRVIVLDEGSRDYLLFPDIEKGVSIPLENRRYILKKLRELANSLGIDNNIPGHDTITLRQNNIPLATQVPLPCKVPNVLLDFNSLQGFELTISGECTTSITNTPLLTSSVVTTGPLSISIRILPLRKYIISMQRYADCRSHLPRDGRVEAWGTQSGCQGRLLGVAQPVCRRKEGIGSVKGPGLAGAVQCNIVATVYSVEARTNDGAVVCRVGYTTAEVIAIGNDSVEVAGWTITGGDWRAYFTNHQGWYPLVIPVPVEACELRVVSGCDNVACQRNEMGFMECCGVCDMGVEGVGRLTEVGGGVKLVPLVLGGGVEAEVDAALLPFSSREAQVVGKDATLGDFIGSSTFPSRYITTPLEHVILFASLSSLSSVTPALLDSLHTAFLNKKPFAVVLLTATPPDPRYPHPPNLFTAHSTPEVPVPHHVYNLIALYLSDLYSPCASSEVLLAS